MSPRPVLRYLLPRLLGWLAMIVVSTNLTYLLGNLFMDPRANYLQLRPPRSADQIDRSLAQYNLGAGIPPGQRWWRWITDITLHWNWGYSPVGESVDEQIGFRTVLSAQLVALSLLFAVVLGIGLGVYTAARQYGQADRFLQILSVIMVNIPVAVASLVVVLLGIAVNQSVGRTLLFVAGARSPGVSGFWPLLIDRVQHLVLPTISLTVISYAGYHLLQRSLLLDVIRSDSLQVARAKGLTRRQAIRRHGLRMSLIPVATSVAFAIPAMFTGSVLTETIFGWQGMGQYFISTIAKNDIHGVVAVSAFAAAMTAVGAILADVAVVVLDPRVRVLRS